MTSWPVELGSYPYRKTITRLGSGVSAAAGEMPLFVALASDADIAAADPNLDGIRITDMDDVPVPFQRIGVDPSYLVGDAIDSWFCGPRAIQSGRKVFYTWVSGHPVGASDAYQGGVYVGSYDLDNPTTAPVRTALQTPFGADDDHNNPSIAVRPDGRILACWCEHNGANMYYAVSTNVGDISSFGATQTFPTTAAGTNGSTGNSYPKPHFIGNTFYMTTRGGDGTFGRPAYFVSDDMYSVAPGVAATFDPVVRLLNAPGRAYMVDVGGSDRIDYFTTDGHPDEDDTSAYHFYLDRSAGRGNEVFRRSDGTSTGKTLASVQAGTPLEISDLTVVHAYSPSNGRAWVWDICHDSDGEPVGLYDVMPYSHRSDGANDINHKLWRAHRNGGSWVPNFVADTGASFADQQGEWSYAGGGFLNHDDPTEVVVSNGILGNHEIESRVKPLDLSTTWTVTPVTKDSEYRQVRPVIPLGRSADCFKFMWHELRHYVDYSTYLSSWRCSPSLPVPPGIARTGALIPFNVTTSNEELRVYFGATDAPLTADGAAVWKDGMLLCLGGEGDASLHTFRELSGVPANATRVPSATATSAALGSLRAISFDGTNTAKVYADPVDLHSAAWLVLQGWVYRSATGQRIFVSGGWQASTTLAAVLVRNSSSNTLEALVVGEANTSIGGAFSDLAISANTMTHWAVTIDPTNGLRGWLNGIPSSTKYGTPGFVMDANPCTNPVVLGAGDFTTTQRMNGKLALTRIEARVFDDDEFRAEYLALTSQGTMFSLGTQELRGLIGRARLQLADRARTNLAAAARAATGLTVATE